MTWYVGNESFYFLPPGGSPNRRGKTNHAYVEDSEEDEADGGRQEVAQASVLPWKRENADSNKPMKQSEFPSWINNKEYTQNYSPYNTVNQGKSRSICLLYILGISDCATTLYMEHSLNYPPSVLFWPSYIIKLIILAPQVAGFGDYKNQLLCLLLLQHF